MKTLSMKYLQLHAGYVLENVHCSLLGPNILPFKDQLTHLALTTPVSTTYLTMGSVIEVSAILVDNITFL